MSACWSAAHAAALANLGIIAAVTFAMGVAMAAVGVVMIIEAQTFEERARRRPTLRRLAGRRLTGHPEQDREIIRSALPGGFVEPVLYVRPPLFVRLALTARDALAPRKGSRR